MGKAALSSMVPIAALVACTPTGDAPEMHRNSAAAPRLEQPASPRQAPELGTLQTRAHRVTVLGTSAEDENIRFTIADLDGDPIARGLTAEQFRARFPELSEQVDHAITADSLDASADLNGRIDAGL